MGRKTVEEATPPHKHGLHSHSICSPKQISRKSPDTSLPDITLWDPASSTFAFQENRRETPAGVNTGGTSFFACDAL